MDKVSAIRNGEELGYLKVEMIEEFRICHKDNPFPAYSFVKEEYRRAGIATRLYLEAAKWVAEKGLRLRSSEVQTNDARALWDNFYKKGLVKREGKFLVFNEK